MPPAGRKRVVIDFPKPLLERTEEAAVALETNRSGLIRRAVEEFLRARQRKDLERELAAACQANAQLNREICEEFKYVDSENV